MRADAEFSPKTKQILAGRAGHRCSFPDCPRPTIGPASASSAFVLTGVAAHIYSASDGGPRGTGGLSKEQRRQPENGIWLCSDHAKIVDTNFGIDYPPSLLRTFKDLHESRISAEQGSRPYFWIEEIRLHRSPMFCDETRLRLGKVTTLVGGNGIGKTQMLRCLAALGRAARPWVTPPRVSDVPFVYTTIFHNPARHLLRIERLSDRFSFELDGKSVSFNPIPVEIAFLDSYLSCSSLETFLERERMGRDDADGETVDDLNTLAEYLEIDPRILQNLVPYVGTFVDHAVSEARIVVKNGIHKLLVNDKNWRPDASIHRISGGMLGMITLDILIASARLSAENVPTALLLQLPKLQLAPHVLERYVSFLSSQEIHFQTVLETPHLGLHQRLRASGSEVASFVVSDGEKSLVQQY